MKKILVVASLLGVTQSIYAAKPEPPLLVTPPSSPALPATSPVSFSWTNSKGAAITNYRLIVSSTSDFGGYNNKTKACRNKTVCFTTTQKETTFSLPITSPILKTDKSYYWRVEAINTGGASTSSIAGFSFGTAAPPIDAKYAIVALPNITAVTTEFPSVEEGNTLKISATIDAPVPTGYTAKVDYGNGLVAMTGSSPDYSATITPTKSASYTVGIYYDKNVLKSNKMTGSFEVTAPIPTNVPPTLKLDSGAETVETNKVYSIELSATDGNGDLRHITIEWGDGSNDSVNVEDGEKVSLEHIYSKEGAQTWKAAAYDYFDAKSDELSKQVTIAKPVVTTETTDTTTATTNTGTTATTSLNSTPHSFTAIDSMGNPILSAYDWKCTLDNQTKLMWELKTNDGNLHDKDWTYSWYEPDVQKNGGFAGLQNNGRCRGSTCNTFDYVQTVNFVGLCGANDWRLPTKEELEGLIFCSDEQSRTLRKNEAGDVCTGKPKNPTIDQTYFQLTKDDWYWTSSTADQPIIVASTDPSAFNARDPAVKVISKAASIANNKKPITHRIDFDSAWTVVFYSGYSHAENKASSARIRLVRDAK